MEFTCTVNMGKGPDGKDIKEKHEISLPDINLDDLDFMTGYFGKDSVTQAAKGNITVQFGKVARTMYEDGKTDDEVIATLLTYKPGARIKVSGGRRKTKEIGLAEIQALREKLNLPDSLGDEEIINIAAELGFKFKESTEDAVPDDKAPETEGVDLVD